MKQILKQLLGRRGIAGGMPLVRAALLKGTKLELRQPSPRTGGASLRRPEYGAFNEIPGR